MRMTVSSLLLAGALLTSTVAAHADYTATYSGGLSGSITIDLGTCDLATSTSCTVVSGHGTLNGTALTLVANPTPGTISMDKNGAYYDDLVYNTFPFIDVNGGLDFKNTGDVDSYVFYSANDNYYVEGSSLTQTGIGYAPSIRITFGSPSSTPEPSSFVLLGTGLLAAAGAARRRFIRS